MKTLATRRNLLKGIASSMLAPALLPMAAAQSGTKPDWMGKGMPQEGPDTPKIADSINLGWTPLRPADTDAGHAKAAVTPPSGQGVTEEAIRGVVQAGVYHVLSGGPPSLPWKAGDLQVACDKLKAGGLSLGNLMMGLPDDVIYGRKGRDESIEKVKESLQAAGAAGVPVVEYNFYAHRAMEAYYERPGRGGAGITSVDYDRMKDLPALPEQGAHNLTEMWANISYFLKAVIPTAEKANVRMALHPNDPPVPLSRGSQQIMGSLAGWKHLIEIVNSPSNGITFDCGVTREMGEDPVTVCRYFGSRDRINHVHFRGPHIVTPYTKYDEGFLDEGDVNLFAVMRELIKQKYTREFYPEHPRALDYDRARGPIRGYPGGGGYAGNLYDLAYGKAMLQAALIVERE
jgi:mannonate dehydratase